MKMFFKIVKYRLIATLKHPVVLICMFGALLCSAYIAIYADKNQENSFLFPIAIVDEDGGEYAEEFIEQISKNKQVDIELLSREKAVNQISIGMIDGAFILLKGFSNSIENNDYEDIVQFISPSVTTSAYPISEIVASEVVDLWLNKLVENSLHNFHNELGDEALLTFEEVRNKIYNDYIINDIINIEFIGDNDIMNNKVITAPIDNAVGVFAAFIIFAIMLSGEWIFNIKKRSLQNRFISFNSKLPIVSLGSQVASIIVSMLFFIPLITFLTIYLKVEFISAFYIVLGMLLYSMSICLIAFIISVFCDSLTQLVIIGTSVSIINNLISSLIVPIPNWATWTRFIAGILPGTYLIECYNNISQILILSLLTFFWLILGYLSTFYLRKIAK